MSPEIVISHIVNKECDNQCDTDEFCFISDGNHQDHWNTKNDVDHLNIFLISIRLDDSYGPYHMDLTYGLNLWSIRYGQYKSYGKLSFSWITYVTRIEIEVNQSHEHENK